MADIRIEFSRAPWIALYISLSIFIFMALVDWGHGDEAIVYFLYLLQTIISFFGLLGYTKATTRSHKIMIIPFLYHCFIVFGVLYLVINFFL